MAGGRVDQTAPVGRPAVRGRVCLRFSPDGKRVYGHASGGWVAWPAGGGPGERLSDDSELDPRGLADVSADGRVAADVLYQPAADGKPAGYTLRVTDLRSGKDRRIPMPADPWWPVAVSDDGRFVYRLGSKEVTAWDAATGEVVFRSGHKVGERLPTAIQLTADGRGLRRLLAVVPARGGPGEERTEVTAFVTDPTSGREWKMDPAPLGVSAGRFSPDGTRLVVRATFVGPLANGAVSVWDTATGQRLCAVPSVSGYPHTFALSADGRALVVGSNDGTVRCVEVATGGERAVFRDAGLILSVAFHPDGTKVASSSPDAPVYVWDLMGQPGRWDQARVDTVWTDLRSAEAKVAFAALRTLRAHPAEAVAFLKERVKVPAAPTDEAVAKLLKGLDATAFAEREALAEGAGCYRRPDPPAADGGPEDGHRGGRPAARPGAQGSRRADAGEAAVRPGVRGVRSSPDAGGAGGVAGLGRQPEGLPAGHRGHRIPCSTGLEDSAQLTGLSRPTTCPERERRPTCSRHSRSGLVAA